MIALPSRLAALALLLFLGACMPGNENTVVDKPLVNDIRLPGLWYEEHVNASRVVLGVREDGPRSLIIDLNFFTKEPGIVRLRAERTRIDGQDILEVEHLQTASLNPGATDWGLPKRFFVAYVLDDVGRLQIYLQDQKAPALEAAVTKGELPGRKQTIGRGEYTIVTAPTADLRAFVAAHPEIFPRPSMIFRRLGPPKTWDRRD